MSTFDYISMLCHSPLPHLCGMQFQTKDTPSPFSNRYEIREDGTLWEELYDIEDHSDPNAEGLDALAGMLTRVNLRWEQCQHIDGTINFYHYLSRKPKRDKLVSLSNHDYIWIELSATFKAGRLVGDIELVRIDHE